MFLFLQVMQEMILDTTSQWPWTEFVPQYYYDIVCVGNLWVLQVFAILSFLFWGAYFTV